MYYNGCAFFSIQLFKDNFAKREVLSLHVHCHAEEHGCRWEGELRNLEVITHVQYACTCRYNTVYFTCFKFSDTHHVSEN